jgi:hypothetical protein
MIMSNGNEQCLCLQITKMSFSSDPRLNVYAGTRVMITGAWVSSAWRSRGASSRQAPR